MKFAVYLLELYVLCLFSGLIFFIKTTPVFADSLHVQGNHFMQNGQIVVLRGAARWSLEFSCGDGHFAISDFQAMKAWGMNIVRLPLNENYFLDSTQCNGNYINTIDTAVKNAESLGMYVLLDLHWIKPDQIANNDPRGGQFPMPDQKAITFWSILGQKYANDPQVMFDLMNEPHPSEGCNVWKNGGTVNSPGNTGWINQKQGSYTAVGFQRLVDTIRNLGANNIIIQGTSGEANSDCIQQTPLTGENIAYQSHFYGTDPNSWQQQYSSLLTEVPIIAGEYDSKQGNKVVPLFESLQTGYLAWAWETNGIIYDWSGTPQNWSQSIKSFIQQHASGWYNGLPPTSQPTTVTNYTTSSNPNVIDDSISGNGLNHWQYQGSGWKHCTNCNELNPPVTYYNASQSWSNVANDIATIKFTGIQAQLIAVVGPEHGIASVSIDNLPENLVDLYSPTKQGSQIVWRSFILSPGTHVIAVKVTGNKNYASLGTTIPIDGLTVISNLGETKASPLLAEGDIDGNGVIDIRDFNILVSCFGKKILTPLCIDINKDKHDTSVKGLYADLDGDGIVDGTDFNILIRNFKANLNTTQLSGASVSFTHFTPQ